LDHNTTGLDQNPAKSSQKTPITIAPVRILPKRAPVNAFKRIPCRVSDAPTVSISGRSVDYTYFQAGQPSPISML